MPGIRNLWQSHHSKYFWECTYLLQNYVIYVTCNGFIIGFPDSSLGKESSSNAGGPGSIPGSGRCTGEGKGYPLQYTWASLVAQLVKIHLQCRRPGFNPWVGKIPWRRARQPTPVFLPGESPCAEEPGGLQPIVIKIQTWLKQLGRYTQLLFLLTNENRETQCYDLNQHS